MSDVQMPSSAKYWRFGDHCLVESKLINNKDYSSSVPIEILLSYVFI